MTTVRKRAEKACTGLNLTAANHVVLYDRWWNPAVEDQARDRAWRIGQTKTVISHRLVCPGTVDERVEEVVSGKRHIANLVLPKSSSLSDLNGDKLKSAVTMLKTYSNLDRETRQLLSGSLRALVGSYAKNVADDVQKNDLEPLRRKLERQRKKAEKRGAKKK